MRLSIYAVAAALPALTFGYPLNHNTVALNARHAAHFGNHNLPVALNRKRGNDHKPVKCRPKHSKGHHGHEGHSDADWSQWHGKHDPASSNYDPNAPVEGHTDSVAVSEPAGEAPTSSWSEPAPAQSEPAPAQSEPAPTQSEPAPAQSEPAPAQSEPAPAPADSEPAPVPWSEPAAAEPTSAWSEPTSAWSESAPVWSETSAAAPAPTETWTPPPAESAPAPTPEEAPPQEAAPAQTEETFMHEATFGNEFHTVEEQSWNSGGGGDWHIGSASHYEVWDHRHGYTCDYAPGSGGGKLTHTDQDYVVALNIEHFGGTWHDLSNCGRTISITFNDGPAFVATVIDGCASCTWGKLDLSPKLFQDLAGSTADWGILGDNAWNDDPPKPNVIRWKFN